MPSRPITRQIDREMELHQATILQPVSGNGAGRKAKTRTETRHGGKERLGNLTTLKLIAKQGADEKAQLEEWKADLTAKLASELVQVQIMHDEAMEASYQEMTKQRERFTLEIEALKEMLKETKEDKARNTRQDVEKNKKGLMNANQPIGEEEETPQQSQSSEIIALTLASPGVKKTCGKAKLRIGSCIETSYIPRTTLDSNKLQESKVKPTATSKSDSKR